MKMNWKSLIFLAALAVAVLVPAPAYADACNVGDFACLTINNVGEAVGSITVHVTLSGNDLIVTAHSDVFTNLNIKVVAMNNTSSGGANVLPGSNPSPNWVQNNNCPCNGDGFGSFNSRAQTGGNHGDTVTFHLAAPPTVGPNANGSTFAVHVSYTDQAGQNCSMWVSDGSQNSNLSSSVSFNKTRRTTMTRLSQMTTSSAVAAPECSSTEVPEPGSLALLGTGLFSAVGVLRRRLGLGA